MTEGSAHVRQLCWETGNYCGNYNVWLGGQRYVRLGFASCDNRRPELAVHGNSGCVVCPSMLEAFGHTQAKPPTKLLRDKHVQKSQSIEDVKSLNNLGEQQWVPQ